MDMNLVIRLSIRLSRNWNSETFNFTSIYEAKSDHHQENITWFNRHSGMNERK